MLQIVLMVFEQGGPCLVDTCLLIVIVYDWFLIADLLTVVSKCELSRGTNHIVFQLLNSE